MAVSKQTHYPECWREHHDCAVAVIERLLPYRDKVLSLRVAAALAFQAYDDDSNRLEYAMARLAGELDD